MAFKAKTITLEESIALKEDLAESVHVEVKEQKAELRASEEGKEEKAAKEKKGSAPKKKVSKRIDWDGVIKDANIDYGKWQTYKRITLVKPIELIDIYDTQNVAVPIELLKRLNSLSKYNASVHMKTIVTNLIIEFLEKNKDILDLMENEFNKKGK